MVIAPSLEVSEAQFQAAVMDLAQLQGWRVCHVRPVAEYRHGRVRHLTAYEGHPGLPDLILARDGQVLLVELKSQRGRASAEQRAWLEQAGAQGRLWRPSDWQDVRRTLARA